MAEPLIDMDDYVKADHPAWQKLRRMYEDGDIETLDRMIQREEALAALGRMGGLIQRVILWLGSIAALFFAVRAFIDNYITAIGTGPK